MIKPNTFIIGAQKSATTSLYHWLAQHPDICGPGALKDYPFFIKEEYFNKGITSLENEYLKEGYTDQKIILQGSVQYMFETKAIENIFEFNSNARLICVVRNPTERAISAYNYFKKLNLEPLNLMSALDEESSRMKNGTERQRYNLTYKSHGLYAQQLGKVFEKFKKEQILVLLYEDMRDNPKSTLDQAFKFLNVDNSFVPDFNRLNVTGKTRFRILHNMIFSKSNIRKFIVDNLVDPIIPLHSRTNIKKRFLDWNTKEIKNLETKINFEEEKKVLKEYFRDDISKLEQLINRNLESWK